MKFIIVIQGTSIGEYESIRQDILDQIKEREIMVPQFLFARLPGDEPLIDIVWTDEKMELDRLSDILKQSSQRLVN